MGTLEEHLARYLEACQGEDPAALLPLMHSEVVRSMGGKAKFLRTIAAVIEARRHNENATGNARGMRLERIGRIQSCGPSHRLAFIRIRFPLFFGGRSILEAVTSVVALSKDGEKTWVFLEANEDGLTLLTKAEGGNLKLPPRPKPELRMGTQEEVVAGIGAEFRKVMLLSAPDGALPSLDQPASKAERALRAAFLERFRPVFQQILQRRLEKPWAKRYFETAWTHITKSFEAVDARRDEESATRSRKAPPKTGRSTIESEVTDLFTHLVPLLFSLYDTYLPNDAPAWMETANRILDTRVPDYRIAVDGARITIDCDRFQLTGSPAGYLSLIGGLWGIARSKTLGNIPCVRYVYELGVMMPRGDFLIRKAMEQLPDHFVSLVKALKAHGSRDATKEAELLLYQLLRNLRYSDKVPQWPELLTELQSSFSQKTVAWLDGYQDVPNSSATTHQSAIKKLAISKYLTSRNPFHRLILVQRLHGHIHDTGSNLLRVSKIFVIPAASGRQASAGAGFDGGNGRFIGLHAVLQPSV